MTALRATAVLLLACVLAAPAQAAVSLSELLQQIRQSQAAEAKLNAEREAAFKRELARQEQQHREALAARNAEEARSNALSSEFDSNEKLVADLSQLLRQHEGNLGELFGVTRQVAGDAANVLQESLISTQFRGGPGGETREEFMRRISGAKALPSILELERLWFELQREMTESAKVVRYNATLINTDESTAEIQVTRIGPFTAVSNGEYLGYLPSKIAFATLSRQPRGYYADIAEDLAAASGGYTMAVVDPARGALLSLVVERPDFFERIAEGEVVGYVIISVGILGAVLWLIQLIYLVMTRLAMAWQMQNLDRPAASNPLGRVLLVFRGDAKSAEATPEVLEMRISEAVLREVPKLERFQPFLRLVVAAGPLLGLVGTVVGMIITFQAITQSGSSDPKLMAHGIGQAMIATVLGLGIAIPLLFANASLASLSRRMVQILDEQSTGMLAQKTGQRRT